VPFPFFIFLGVVLTSGMKQDGCAIVSGRVDHYNTYMQAKMSAEGKTMELKSVVMTIRTDWKAKALFLSMLLCMALIIGTVVIMTRLA
jgi:hypothetical protein